MAEAVAALGLAANVLQVVDYGSQFVGTAWKIWKNGREGLEALTALQNLAQNLKDVSLQLHVDTTGSGIQAAGDKGIFEAAAECSKVAQQILDSLERIGLPLKGRKRDAAMAAFRLTWRSDDIQELQTRLDRVGNQLTLNLAISLRTYAMQSLTTQDTILQHLNKAQGESSDRKVQIDQMNSRHKGFGSTVVQYLTYRRDLSESTVLEKALRDALFGAVYTHDDAVSRDIDERTFGITADRAYSLRKGLLSALQYDGMDDREVTVAEAHQSTFRWVFEDETEQNQPWANFRKWLESDHQLYWITGKAGSGKSTLMKFVSQSKVSELSDPEPQCLQHLRQWSGNQPLVIASFYFWAAGSKMQTSKAGLYRSLLYQLLEKEPEMTAQVFPDRWEALCLFNEDPKPLTEDELRQSLSRLVLLLGTTTKLCLFIDGLDEFDGDYDTLIELLTHIITTSSSVKLCVASRPWVVFEEALKNKPSLRLEDLTFNDIKKYVTSRFQADSNFSVLYTREFLFADSLMETVVRKADGVFLWVKLVVSSLLNGMKFGDRVSDLQRRLDSLPPDLEDLYDRILQNLDPFYFEHAAQYFSLMAACREPPSAILFSFADEDDQNFALDLSFRTKWNESDFEARIETISRRLNSRCKGLIEVGKSEIQTHSSSNIRRSTVQYLHKTVKDYIEKPHVKRLLLSGLKSPFDPHLRLCAANQAMCKVELSVLNHDLVGYQWVISLPKAVAHCMRHAAQVSVPNKSHMIQLLDQLGRVISDSGYASQFNAKPGSFGRIAKDEGWYDDAVGDEIHSISPLESFGNTFLSLAVKCDVVEYVRARVEKGCHVQSSPLGFQIQPIPVLVAATPRKYKTILGLRRLMTYWAERDKAKQTLTFSSAWPLLSDAIISARPNVAMVSLLLDKGADPNISYPTPTYHPLIDYHGSIWEVTLVIIIDVFSHYSYDLERTSTWLDIARLMVAHGAHTQRKDILRAWNIVGEYFDTTILDMQDICSKLERAFRHHKRGVSELQLDFLSDLRLEPRKAGDPVGFIAELEG